MKWQLAVITVVLGALLSSCGQKAQESSTEGAPHATVSLRDGTLATGTITKNSATEVTLVGDDGITRTIPVKQVSSIQYGDAVPAAPQTAASNAGPPPPPMPQAPTQQPRASSSSNSAPKPAASRPAPPPPPPPPGMRAEPDGMTETHSHPPASAITTKTYVVPVGTTVSIRTEETIDSAKAVEGQTYAGEVTEDVLDADGATVIPKGANAQLIIRSASKGGKIRGASDLVIDVQEVAIDGQEYQVSTSDLVEQGKAGVGANKRTAIYSGGGAALGAIIGAIAGGGKGAAIGAGAGAGGGALTQILTKGSAIRIPVETVLNFKLDKALRVTKAQ